MVEDKIEDHPLKPFLSSNAKLLMLGSFPPKPERWKMDFYYPNFQNDMWRIFGMVFFADKDHFLTVDRKSFCEREIRDFLQHKGIALTDTAEQVVRLKDNAADQFLEVVTPIDIEKTMGQLPECLAIATTGQKATDTLLTLIDAEQPKVGGYSRFEVAGRRMCLYRMPSSSRAYPKPLQEKADVYADMFRELGML